MQKLKKLIASGSEKEAHKGTMEDVLPRAIVHAELGTDENIFASPTLQGLYSKALLWSWSPCHHGGKSLTAISFCNRRGGGH